MVLGQACGATVGSGDNPDPCLLGFPWEWEPGVLAGTLWRRDPVEPCPFPQQGLKYPPVPLHQSSCWARTAACPEPQQAPAWTTGPHLDQHPGVSDTTLSISQVSLGSGLSWRLAGNKI